jgi:thiamine-phosphate pyrophosphorylase
MESRISGLYAVTPDLADTDVLLEKVDAALRGGARVVQYRSKGSEAGLQRSQAVAIAGLCRKRRALFIVNDSAELARETGADGVHLGKDDGAIGRARATLGAGKLIGVSCYNEIGLARAAMAQGADYVAFGSFFSSGTKPAAVRADLRLLHAAAVEIALPIVAIGGIDVDNAADLIAGGADAVAVIGALFEVPDVEAQARRFVDLFQTPVHS